MKAENREENHEGRGEKTETRTVRPAAGKERKRMPRSGIRWGARNDQNGKGEREHRTKKSPYKILVNTLSLQSPKKGKM